MTIALRFFSACLLAMLLGQSVWAANERPNVVFILADDLGWSDTTLFGTTKLYRTPNIQRLAKRGMTFTHAYSSSPLCSPTRASILTGQSPARTGITTPNCHGPNVVLKASVSSKGQPNAKATIPQSVSRLDTGYYTLAETFKANGYATGHFGKWHLGAPPYSPLEHGFDVDIPHWPGPGPAGSYVAPWKFPDFDPQTPDEHIEDRMATEAVAFMQKHKSQPFFLNYWMFSVHAPFDAKQALINQYKPRINPTDSQRSPTYAAMIESMDDAVGTLMDTLDRLGIADNTIIVFASDNGGNMYNEIDNTTPTSNAPLRGGKATMFEGGVRGPAIVVQPGVVASNTRSDEVIQSSDFYPTLLDMLSIQPQPNQTFDGISIVPALAGGKLKRDAIFTYFPHLTRVPDWLPPAVSVHKNDWKLIRIFHGGENGQHRYKLFNLVDDIGEQKDRSAEFPDRVKGMDLLIEDFLVRTNAVVPKINQNFNPATYNPKLEGIPPASRKSTKSPKRQAKKVAGWQGEGNAKLSVESQSLRIKSAGNDPHISFMFPKAFKKQPMKLQLTMKSQSRGDGQIFWHEQGVKPAFFRDRSVGFQVNHDNSQRQYTIDFAPQKPLQGIRIDPSKSAGEMQITKLQLTTADGRVIYRWSF